jgi:DNA-directed RNA polymerase specialized sigma24 family protein
VTDDPDRPAFEAFVLAHGPELVGFARRLTMDHHRGEDIVQDVLARLGLSAGGAVAAIDSDVVTRDEATTALATLRPVQRAVLVLRYHHDLPDAEIAAMLGCRESTVRSHARRGLAGLRQHLGATTPAAPGPTLSEGTPR